MFAKKIKSIIMLIYLQNIWRIIEIYITKISHLNHVICYLTDYEYMNG